MARKRPFGLSYDPATKEHLRAIEAKYHSLIRSVIEEQLLFEPERETRNRKPLQQPAPLEATWELRLRPPRRATREAAREKPAGPTAELDQTRLADFSIPESSAGA